MSSIPNDVEFQERISTNKVWCFENGVTAETVNVAWNNAKTTNKIVKSFVVHGLTCWELPNHLFKQLIERYS